jgi:hypothetical protein
MSHHLLFDKTVAVKQLHVVEAHGILLLRTDRGNCAIFVPAVKASSYIKTEAAALFVWPSEHFENTSSTEATHTC